MLELVGRDDAVPELMAGFVDRHALRLRHRARRQPARAGGEERRILHAVRAALPRRIDDGDVRVGIRAEPLAVVAQRRARRVEVALGLTDVLGLQQQPHRHWRQAVVAEPLDALDVVRARRPGEIVDVLRIVMMRRRAVALVAPTALGAGGADDPAVRDRQPHVVDAEVGEELGRGVELMAVPAGVLEDADLRKPLREEVVVADRSRARERARHAGRPGDLDVDGFAGRHRRRRAAPPPPSGRPGCHRRAR